MNRRAYEPQQRNAGGAEQKRGPDLGRRTRTLAGGDHEPQHQQRGCHRGRSDHGRKGFKDQHLGRQICHFSGLSTVQNAPAVRTPSPAVSRSTAPADVLQLCIHARIFGADRIHIFCGVDFRRRDHAQPRSCRADCRRRRPAKRPCHSRRASRRIRDRFAFRCLRDSRSGTARKARRVRQRISFQPLIRRWNPGERSSSFAPII